MDEPTYNVGFDAVQLLLYDDGKNKLQCSCNNTGTEVHLVVDRVLPSRNRNWNRYKTGSLLLAIVVEDVKGGIVWIFHDLGRPHPQERSG